MTQLEAARAGKITEDMEQVGEDEGVSAECVRAGVARGEIVIPKNVKRRFRAIGIGKGLRTKVNANIGASNYRTFIDEEVAKLEVAIRYGADSIMDLSTGTEIDRIRRELISRCGVILGTVPIYQAASETSVREFDPDKLFECIERQAEQGVDFMTLHCGVTRQSVSRLRQHQRLEGIVSRGGALIAAWMEGTDGENPLLEGFDRVMEICRRHDVTISRGDGLRPGAIADSTDRGQVGELLVMGELTQRAREAGIQVMVEGPGHVPIDQIEANVLMEKRFCDGAPFYVLGPLTTDVAPGYDHITGAIGGAIAAAAGADFLCYVTPAEHLRLPDLDDVRDGVLATRIAAHSGDIRKGIAGARQWDDMMSRYRKALDWEGMYSMAMDPEKARRYKESSEAAGAGVCSMCGNLCSIAVDNATVARAGGSEAAGKMASSGSPGDALVNR